MVSLVSTFTLITTLDFYSESRLYSFKDSIKVFALIKTDFVKV